MRYGKEVLIFKTDKHIFIEIKGFKNKTATVSNTLNTIINYLGFEKKIKSLKIESGLFNITIIK